MSGLQALAESASGQRAVAGTQAVPVGQAAGVSGGAAVPARMAPAAADDADHARGHKLASAVRTVVQQNPQALGPYIPPAESGERGVITQPLQIFGPPMSTGAAIAVGVGAFALGVGAMWLVLR